MSDNPWCHVPLLKLCKINAVQWHAINIPGRRNLPALATSTQITKFHFASWIYIGIFFYSHFFPSLVSRRTYIFNKVSVILNTKPSFIHKPNAHWHSEISPLWPERWTPGQGRNLPAIMFNFSTETTRRMQICVLWGLKFSSEWRQKKITIQTMKNCVSKHTFSPS